MSIKAVLNALDAQVREMTNAVNLHARVIASLVELANPEHLRRARAAIGAREGLARVDAGLTAGTLVSVSQVSDGTAMVLVCEMRGVETVTPQLILDATTFDAKTKAAFLGKGPGDRIDTGVDPSGAYAVIGGVWDTKDAARKPARRGR